MRLTGVGSAKSITDARHEKAEPDARANAPACHDPCLRTASAKQGRGSSLTLGVMGKHTAYWEEYARSQARGTLRMLGAILAWVLVVVLIVLLHETLGAAFPWMIGAAFLGFIITLIRLGANAQKVICPECGSAYTRSRLGGQCSACGLRIMQHDP